MANEMRDRLVELIQDALFQHAHYVAKERLRALMSETEAEHSEIYDNIKFLNEFVADHLIESGVIVPPCKVGDEVYYIHETYWDKDYKKYIRTKSLKQDILEIVEMPDSKTNLMLEVKEFDFSYMDDWLNGKIFLTKEKAEQKLKEIKEKRYEQTKDPKSSG